MRTINDNEKTWLIASSNVDRLWDIWQALNPNAYIIDKIASQQEANFFIEANTHITANTDLKPFYDSSNTNFWDSARVKYGTPFGYAYPETQPWLYSDNGAYQTAVRNQVTAEYGANVINEFFANIAPAAAKPAEPSPLTTAPKHAVNKGTIKHALQHPIEAAKEVWTHAPSQDHNVDATANGKQLPAANGTTNATTQELDHQAIHNSTNTPTTQDSSSSVPVTSAPPKDATSPATQVPITIPSQFEHLVKDRTYTEWVTNLRTIKHALNQTFRVYVFLGDFNPDPTTWPTEHNVVGRFTVLGRGDNTQCSKCQQDRVNGLVVTGTVPLTSALLQDIVAGQLHSLEPAEVAAYLEKNLHWRITVFDGSEVPRDQVPGLKVSVVSTKVRIGDDGVPVYSGVYEQYPRITDGRPAGLAAGEAV